MFATTYKLVSYGLQIQLVEKLFIDTEYHHVVQSWLAHGTLDSPQHREWALASGIRRWHDEKRAMCSMNIINFGVCINKNE